MKFKIVDILQINPSTIIVAQPKKQWELKEATKPRVHKKNQNKTKAASIFTTTVQNLNTIPQHN